MKSLKILAVTGALVAVFALAGCESHTSSTTNFEVSTSTEEGTKEYTYSSSTKDGVTTSTETTVETPADAAAQDPFFDDVRYHLEDDGTLTVTGPYSEAEWCKVIGNFDNVEILNEGIDEGMYKANVRALIDNGEAQIVAAHALAGQKDPTSYAVLTIPVENGKILGVDESKTQFTDDLAKVFGEVEKTP